MRIKFILDPLYLDNSGEKLPHNHAHEEGSCVPGCRVTYGHGRNFHDFA